MKKYSPGASAHDDFAYGCDNCGEWGSVSLIWKDLTDDRDHFSLCRKCISKLYLEYCADVDKKDELLTVRRMTVSEELRNEIYERDEWKCKECGNPEKLTLDHIVPFSKGGKTEKSNLQTLCQKCNLAKRDK